VPPAAAIGGAPSMLQTTPSGRSLSGRRRAPIRRLCGVSASPSPASNSRPAGLPDRPLANRPRRSRTPCSPCFIRSRSGIANSHNIIPAPAQGAEGREHIVLPWQFNGCAAHPPRLPVGLQPTDLDPWGRPGPNSAIGTGLRGCNSNCRFVAHSLEITPSRRRPGSIFQPAWRFPKWHSHRKCSKSGACGTMGPGLRRERREERIASFAGVAGCLIVIAIFTGPTWLGCPAPLAQLWRRPIGRLHPRSAAARAIGEKAIRCKVNQAILGL
jgi:hypothetical protein